MAEETSVAAPEVGSEGANVAPPTETPQEPQTTSAPQVEGVDNPPQVREQPRPYDGLFRKDRNRIKRLEETNAQLNEKIDKLLSSIDKKDVPALDHQTIFQDPDRYLTAREQKLREEIQALRSEFTSQREQMVAKEKERLGLEALEKLFPKSSPDSKESLQERVTKDPERAEALKDFFEDPEIKAIADINPDKAVKLALAEFGISEKKTDPTVLKKTAMGGIKTGNPSGGMKTSLGEDDLRAELKKLNEQLNTNPTLRYDDNFKKRKMEVMSSLGRLVKENRK